MKIAVNIKCEESVGERVLKGVCLKILKVEGVRSDVVVSLSAVTSKEIEALNRKYLQRDFPTDVLAFPMGEESGEGFLLGDVVICPEIIEQRKEQYEVEEGRELEFVTAHGLLHLLGYDDGDERGCEEMDRKQRDILKLWGWQEG